MIVELTQVQAVSARDRDDMFALMDHHFEGMVRAIFEKDLMHKHWVILVKHEGNVVGFTVIQLMDRGELPDGALAVYSGDTLVSSSHRNSTAFVKGWFAAMRYLQGEYAERELYWFLLCSSFRTYRFMPVYWKEFYPRYGLATPGLWKERMHSLSRARFGGRYNPSSGIVRFAHPQVLRACDREIPRGREKNPDIVFFANANPGHASGDELVCLTRICRDNLTAAGTRFWDADDFPFEIITHEPVLPHR